ncbi:DUF805 domain-containing protein [Flavobacterium sp. Fl-77]|uniref:DUF805 domain-containing protein n=1 Tax=Flavobacterium flavipigmentatum TaxID=2893884 RepID=A0AAJ2VVT8_9FLAO|nr:MULTISPECIES: DUF805 domain-containing protein [unclassified Flavobacterium]MDX6180838.1 DUF805 domain-containing protein [Flavobacterium sp. Fl-33]MDX6184438.1 DUF805 domain-containing protein [Flavobacterium sp. Fl-77]UFH39547.1 DUF805 domain-containing protein [Flavobacterium sp. F-70]
MIEWYKKVVFENYANFKGRARRSEYWYFALANGLISIALMILGGAVGGLFGDGVTGVMVGYALFLLYTLATLIPTLGVVARRLHDVNKSGWFYFVSFIPLVGPIWILILFCTEGDAGSNQYGPDPKNETDQISEIGSVEVQ